MIIARIIRSDCNLIKTWKRLTSTKNTLNYVKNRVGGPLGPWQALLMSPKRRNTSWDGFVNLKISFDSITPFGSLAPSALALLFCFSLKIRFLSIVTTWN